MNIIDKKFVNGFLIAALVCVPHLAQADCNQLPERPSILEKSHLLYSELDIAKTSIDSFVDQTTVYQDCLSKRVSSLNIDFDNPDESPDKTAELSRIQALSELLNQNQKIAVDRYNQLLNSVEYSDLEE